jgi:hypothetical protein
LGSYQGYRHSEFDNGSVCGVRILVAAVVASIGAFALLLKLVVEINNAVFSSNPPLTSNQQPTIAGVIGSGMSPIFEQIWNAIKLCLAYIVAKFVSKQFTPWNLRKHGQIFGMCLSCCQICVVWDFTRPFALFMLAVLFSIPLKSFLGWN